MNITRLAIENNRTTWVLLVVILFAGTQAYLSMPRAYDPGFIIRAAQVVTHFPGASPERVEALISDKIEKVVQEIPELDFVSSESRTGVSIIIVNIKESYTNMRPIWDSLRRKIEGVKNDLPSGVIGPIVNDEFGDIFGIVLALTGEGFSYAELKSYADNAREALLHPGYRKGRYLRRTGGTGVRRIQQRTAGRAQIVTGATVTNTQRQKYPGARRLHRARQ